MGQTNSDLYELRKSVMIFQSREKNTFRAYACWVQFFRDIDYQFEELWKLFYCLNLSLFLRKGVTLLGRTASHMPILLATSPKCWDYWQVHIHSLYFSFSDCNIDVAVLSTWFWNVGKTIYMWMTVNHESLIKIGQGNGCNWTQAGARNPQANPGPQDLSWGEDIHGLPQYLVIQGMWFPLCWGNMWWRNGKEREAEMLMCCRKRENERCKESLLATWAIVMSGPSWSEGGSCVVPRTYSSQGLSLCLWLLLQPVVVWVLVNLPPRTCCCPKANQQLVLYISENTYYYLLSRCFLDQGWSWGLCLGLWPH